MSPRPAFRLLGLASLCLAAGIAAAPCEAARIEAIAGKSYTLGKQHGPWMIMVATFHTTGADGKTQEGKSPQQAADDLVLELRQIGLPAYTFEVEVAPETISLVDRTGQEVHKKNLRRVKSLCVLAGNYSGNEDDVGQKTLAWLKKFSPKSLQEGVAFTPTKTRPTPLSSAFLCVNPLLSPDELTRQERERDPLLRQLNSGVQHSLTENKGEYTLMVSIFGGKQVSQFDHDQSASDLVVGNSLDVAGQQANELVMALRQDLDPNKKFRNLDAYVWHDHDRSIVTVGSFSSPDDPAIANYFRQFMAMRNPASGQVEPQYLALGGAQPKVWAFVPVPQLIEVPHLK